MELSADLPFNVYYKEYRKARERVLCAYQSEFREKRITLKDKNFKCGNLVLITSLPSTFLSVSISIPPVPPVRAMHSSRACLVPRIQHSWRVRVCLPATKDIISNYLSLFLSSSPLLLLAGTRLSLLFSMKWSKELFAKENVDYYPHACSTFMIHCGFSLHLQYPLPFVHRLIET